MCSVSNSGRILLILIRKYVVTAVLAYLYSVSISGHNFIRKCVVTAVLAYLHCLVSHVGRIFAYFD
jgi:hypothetical protein